MDSTKDKYKIIAQIDTGKKTRANQKTRASEGGKLSLEREADWSAIRPGCIERLLQTRKSVESLKRSELKRRDGKCYFLT